MMGKKYLVNAFAVGMLQLEIGGEAVVKIRRLNQNEFCEGIKNAESAIGHEGTAGLISQLCGITVVVNRQQIKLGSGDVAYIITVMTRLPEGKVLTQEELEAMLKADQVAFWKVEVL